MPWFDGHRGHIHHDARLPQGEVRSVVVFLHGFGEHLGLYDAMTARLTASGHAVHLLDCVGHGHSDGERGLITWDSYAEDATRLVRLAAAAHPGVPVTLAGHSAGALAAYLVALRRPELVDALLLSGGPLLPLDWVTGEAETGAGSEEQLDPAGMLSTHPDYVHALLHDPLVYAGDFPAPMLESLVATWPEAEAGLAAGLPDLPVLVVHGEVDPVVPVSVARTVRERLPQASLQVYAGDLHDVLNEHDRDDVHEDFVRFLDSVAQVDVSAAASPEA